MKTWILALMLLVPSLIFGQGAAVLPQPAMQKGIDGRLVPLSGAMISVCAANTITIPCLPVLSNAVFADAALTQPKTNPFFADLLGNYNFAIAPGNYTITVGNNPTGYSYQITISCPVAVACNWTFPQNFTGGGTLSGTWSGSPIFSGAVTLSNGGTLSGTWAGNPSFSGSPVFNNSVTLSSGGSLSGTFSGNHTLSGFVTFSSGTSLGPNIQVFNTSGTFTIPVGVTKIKVTVVGSGGAGGGSTSGANNGSGGGSGSAAVKYLSNLTPGNTLVVTVGLGGTGVSGAGNNGNSSIIASGTQTISTITAPGGGGGASAGVFQGGGLGGVAPTGGDLNFGGNAGMATYISGSGGGGGGSIFGGAPCSGCVGQAGLAPGAGGTGSNSGVTTIGGNGADGVVIFEWVN